MRRHLAGLLILCMITQVHLSAWGFEAHKYLADRAIGLLPAPIRPFFEKHRIFLVEHSIDPDLWRTVGFAQEPPNHFLDLDAYGPYPFSSLPRDRAAAIRKFGRRKVEREGMLPWRVAEMYDRLVKAFEGQRLGTSPYALSDAQFLSAVLAHYVGDAHVPFHASKNYDGQLTRQHGIHNRFERDLFERYKSTLSIQPPSLAPVPHARDFIFEALLKSFEYVEPVLQADRKAVAGRDEYDEKYFDQFFAGSRQILELRLARAITGIASVIASAWERGGRPELPLAERRGSKKVGSR